MNTTKLQSLDTIAPAVKKKATDPAQALYDEGKDFLEKKELAQAAVALHNALLAFEEDKNINGVANASNQLGHVCLQRLEFEKALKHYQRAWTICEKEDDPMSLMALSNQLIAVYQGLKQYPEAVKICLDLLDSYNRNNNPKGAVETLERMVAVYLDAGEMAKAADAYRTIAAIHSRYKHKSIAEQFVKKAQALEEAV
jgi:tetratricopeptide (TPR) repeat protein